MRIVVDGFGGDNAPLEILKGCEMAVKELSLDIIVTGDERALAKVALENGINMNKIAVKQADSIIDMKDDPMAVVGDKKDSSMAVAFETLRDGEADAMVSAGNTGAAVVGGSMILKRLKGVKRPALGNPFPSRNGHFLLLDIGANIECRPEMLLQFALMGSAYAEGVMGVKNPKVGLLNNGKEETKGTEVLKAAHLLLKEAPINFIGNVEGSDINNDICDVVVTDGYGGNIVLKLTEGLSKALFGMIKDTIMEDGLRGKLGALLLKPSFAKLKKRTDPNEYGGVPLLGTQKPLIKAHGSSNAYAFFNAIKRAKEYHENGVIAKMEENLAKIKTSKKEDE